MTNATSNGYENHAMEPDPSDEKYKQTVIKEQYELNKELDYYHPKQKGMSCTGQ